VSWPARGGGEASSSIATEPAEGELVAAVLIGRHMAKDIMQQHAPSRDAVQLSKSVQSLLLLVCQTNSAGCLHCWVASGSWTSISAPLLGNAILQVHTEQPHEQQLASATTATVPSQ
jgi:hypothetical protein